MKMKTKKKQIQGISLIVLVITIIIMIILAGAIILTLNNSGIIERAKEAKDKSDEANGKEYLEILKFDWGLMSDLEKEEYGSFNNYAKEKLMEKGYTDEDMLEKILSNIQVNENKIEAIADMFSVAQTYKNNASALTFGSLKTAYDDITDNDIDCSSFLQLVLEGIPYEESKYNSKTVNTKTYEYGIKFPDNPYRSGRWLANDIAHYAYDNDYSFFPNSDVSNVMPGDIIFFRTNGGSSEYFMGITHASIVVERLNSDRILVFHGNNTNTVGYQILNLFSEKTESGTNNGYYNGAALIARFPLNETTNKLNTSNLITNGDIQVINHNGATTTCLKTLELSQPLKANTAYTMLVDMSLGTEEYPDIFPRFVANSYSNDNMITDLTYTWVTDNKYLVHFITNDTITVNNIKIYMISQSNIANKYREGSFYSAKLYEGMLTKQQIDNMK